MWRRITADPLEDAAAIMERIRKIMNGLVLGFTDDAIPPDVRSEGRPLGPGELKLVEFGRTVKTGPLADVMRTAHDSSTLISIGLAPALILLGCRRLSSVCRDL